MKNYKTIYSWMMVLLSVVYAGCDSETTVMPMEEDELSVKVSMSISAQMGEQTRVWTDANAWDGEMMNNWIIVITDTNDKIEKIINSTFSEIEKEIDYSNDIELTIGTKRFYSFANVRLSMVANGTPTEGATLNLKSNFSAPANGLIPSDGIPMSNVQTINIRNVQQQTIHVEVVRMMAKVTLKLINQSGIDLLVDNIGIDNLTKEGGSISTLPILTPTTSSSIEDFTYSWGEPQNFPADEDTLRLTIYINESVVPASSIQQNHILRVGTLRQSDNAAQEGRFALLNWSSFLRNQYSIIPIIIDDYRLVLEALDYPPIGVYPAVITSSDYRDFVCTFSAGGDFEIYPNLTQFSTGNAVDFESVVIEKISDAALIIAEEPTYNPETNEIIGAINDNEGIAHYKLIFTIKKSDTLTQELTYNLFLKH